MRGIFLQPDHMQRIRQQHGPGLRLVLPFSSRGIRPGPDHRQRPKVAGGVWLLHEWGGEWWTYLRVLERCVVRVYGEIDSFCLRAPGRLPRSATLCLGSEPMVIIRSVGLLF